MSRLDAPTSLPRAAGRLMRHGRLRRWIAGVLLGGFLPFAASAGEPPPLTVVRVGKGDVEGLKRSLTKAYLGCAEHLHLRSPMPALPSDLVLSQLVLYHAEELFDGPRWAYFEAQATVAADPAQSCTWAIYWQRSVTIETACVSHGSGHSSYRGMPQELGWVPTEPAGYMEEARDAADCQDRERPVSFDGLPREVLAGGYACVWSSLALSRRLQALTGRSGNLGERTDTCLYDARPHYFSHGKSWPVILAQKFDVRETVQKQTGELRAASQVTLERLSSSPIEPRRFTRAEAEAFLALPGKQALQPPR